MIQIFPFKLSLHRINHAHHFWMTASDDGGIAVLRSSPDCPECCSQDVINHYTVPDQTDAHWKWISTSEAAQKQKKMGENKDILQLGIFDRPA